MTLDQINFTALEQIKNAWSLAIKQIFKSFSLSSMVLIVLVVVSVLLLFVSPNFLTFSLVMALIIIGAKANKVKQQAWRQFAADNHWPINAGDTEVIPPGLQNIGHDRKTSEVINAQFNNLSCDLLFYQYTEGSGKSSHTYYFTIVRNHLNKQFPHIILDSKKNFSQLRNIPGNYENLKLEGDFYKYFNLYEAKGEEVDVLSIITPDVMQVLIDAQQQQDIEIFSSYLYFVAVSDKRTPEAMRTLLTSVNALAPEILHRAQTLNYQPIAQVA